LLYVGDEGSAIVAYDLSEVEERISLGDHEPK